jgi:DNA-binding response OmpR family regulator
MTARSRRDLRIVIADDEADAASTLHRLLSVRGFQVIAVAYDGQMALDLAHSAQPDVLILDIGMPQLSGLEVARRVREKLGQGPRLIAVTGWGTQQDQLATKEAGFDAHFVKPVKWSELESLLASYISNAAN